MRTLLLFATGFAIVLASMVYPSPLIGDLYYTIGLLTVAFAVIAAIYFRASRRAFWVGFLVLFAGYYCHTVWPGEVRGTWAMIMRQGGIGYMPQGVVTTRLLTYLYEALQPPMNAQRQMYPTRNQMMPDELSGKYVSFMTVGHTVIAFLLGIGGGFLARWFALQAVPLMRRPIEKILSDMDTQ